MFPLCLFLVDVHFAVLALPRCCARRCVRRRDVIFCGRRRVIPSRSVSLIRLLLNGVRRCCSLLRWRALQRRQPPAAVAGVYLNTGVLSPLPATFSPLFALRYTVAVCHHSPFVPPVPRRQHVTFCLYVIICAGVSPPVRSCFTACVLRFVHLLPPLSVHAAFAGIPPPHCAPPFPQHVLLRFFAFYGPTLGTFCCRSLFDVHGCRLGAVEQTRLFSCHGFTMPYSTVVAVALLNLALDALPVRCV